MTTDSRMPPIIHATYAGSAYAMCGRVIRVMHPSETVSTDPVDATCGGCVAAIRVVFAEVDAEIEASA